MDQWYYAREGKQSGPISRSELGSLAGSGGLDPMKDLVWNSSMKDWTPAGKIEGLFIQAPGLPPADSSNPYSTPASAWNPVAQITAGEALAEIAQGSEPIDVMGCVKRAFELTKRHFGMLLLLMVVYIGVSMVVGIIGAILDHALGLEVVSVENFAQGSSQSASANGPVASILNQLVSIFLTLGATRAGLNIVSGKEFSLGDLFSGGAKFLPALGGMILYGLMVAIGFLLLVVPGIYLALRYGAFLSAMVDRDLGVFDSFKYSSSLTTNNRARLLGLLGMSIVLILAGILALCVGIFFALPVMWLSWAVAYRWMQYGHRAALDHHGTTTPMLAKNGF